jgi:predicted hydrocarbon binding protein
MRQATFGDRPRESTRHQYAIKGHMRVWRHFQDSGEWEVVREAANEISGVLREYVIDEAICTELTGYFDRSFEFTGVTNVRTDHVRCRARGADVCQFRVRWR